MRVGTETAPIFSQTLAMFATPGRTADGLPQMRDSLARLAALANARYLSPHLIPVRLKEPPGKDVHEFPVRIVFLNEPSEKGEMLAVNLL